MPDRELARGFDQIVNGLPALLADQLADELAEPVNVLAQGTVLLIEIDIRA